LFKELLQKYMCKRQITKYFLKLFLYDMPDRLPDSDFREIVFFNQSIILVEFYFFDD